MPSAKTIGNRIAPAKFLVFLLLLGVGWTVGVAKLGFEQGLLGGFDIAAVVFLVSCAPLFKLGTAALRQAATQNDANRIMLLGISILLSLVILAAIAVQLSNPDALTVVDKVLIVATLVLVWTFGNAVYTLHYAHLFYSTDDGGKDMAGLKFPGTKLPDMADFAYFAYTLGVAVQTSDVEITSPHIRRIATIHCIAGFFFNLGVLALTINVVGSS
ncbi:MAG: DUF1345 domain-containing protein [Sphingomicrobium sp.]